jgi:hypothetical protein
VYRIFVIETQSAIIFRLDSVMTSYLYELSAMWDIKNRSLIQPEPCRLPDFDIDGDAIVLHQD